MVLVADPLAQIRALFHFTDVKNIPSIRALGGLASTALLKQAGKAFCPGGDEDSLALDARCGLDKYVHLCFIERHPMAFRLMQRNSDADLIYLRIETTILHEDGVLFATGVGYAFGVETVPVREAVERNLIDFKALYSWTDWNDPQAQEKRHAAELCEILVPDRVALNFIRNLPQ